MAKKRKRKAMTDNQREFSRQVSRIKRAVKRLEKRGYYDIVVPVDLKKPQRVTKSRINKLKSITTKDLYDLASYVSRETGEIMSGNEGRKLERQVAAKKGLDKRKQRKTISYQGIEYPQSNKDVFEDEDFYADIIINGFKANVRHFNLKFQEAMFTWLGELERHYEKADIAEMLEAGANAGYVITYEMAYDSQKLQYYITNMMRYMPEMSPWIRDKIEQAIEEEEVYNY